LQTALDGLIYQGLAPWAEPWGVNKRARMIEGVWNRRRKEEGWWW